MPITAQTLGAAGTGTFISNVYTDTYDLGLTSSNVAMVALNFTAGFLYQIDTDDSSTLGDAYLRVFDQFGNEVKANDNGLASGEGVGGNLDDAYTEFLPNYTGLYYVALSYASMTQYDPTTTVGRPFNIENLPTVAAGSLVVTQITFEQSFPDDNAINTIIGSYDTSNESFVIGDEDRQIRLEYTGNTSIFPDTDIELGRFDLVRNDRVVVDVNGLVDALNPLDVILRIFTSNGVTATQIGFDNGGGTGNDSELIFFAPETGDFYLGVSGLGNSTYNALDGTGTLAGDTGEFEVIIHRNPTLIGSSVTNNNITGTATADYIVGLSGNDSLTGGEGFDTLAGGDDNDSLLGENGEDVIYGEFGNDTLDGGGGTDVLRGGHGDDSLLGGSRGDGDILQGDQGNDTLDGAKGADTLAGGDGNDSLIGGTGNNLMDGGAGLDTITGGSGRDTATGGNDADTIDGAGGNDSLAGGNGNDTLAGGSANDILVGDDFNDSLVGGSGLDTLRGGTGNDVLTGGTDADVFDFNAVSEGTDVITDFKLGIDDIDLRDIFGAGVVNLGNLSQFVQSSTSGVSDSFLAVDANGLVGGLSFTIIAQVNGVTAVQIFDANNFLL